MELSTLSPVRWSAFSRRPSRADSHSLVGLAGTIVRLYAAQNYLGRERLASAPSIREFMTRRRYSQDLVSSLTTLYDSKLTLSDPQILHLEIAEADIQQVAEDLHARADPHEYGWVRLRFPVIGSTH